MNVLDYRMKRHLLFDGLSAGGLEREPEGDPQYRVAIGGSKPVAPDWGYEGRKVLFQQCADCHLSPKLKRLGVASIPSIVHSGGFGARGNDGGRSTSESRSGRCPWQTCGTLQIAA